MRIIAGKCKGRKLHPPSGLSLRPTADHLRESVFNILAGQIEGTFVLDLFAGTGGLGIEALSRGANSCVFVDKSHQAVNLIGRNLSTCRLADQARVIQKDIARGLGFLEREGLRFDMVFADPPYNKGFVAPTLLQLDASGYIDEDAGIVVEHSTFEGIPETMTHLVLMSQRRYGKTLVSFYRYMV